MLESSPYLGLGFQLAGAVLIYTGLGYLLDRWLGTSPRFLVAGAVVGMLAFFVQLVRVVRQMNSKTRKESVGKTYRDVDEGWNGEPERDEWKERWEDKDDWGADGGSKESA